MVLFTLGTGIGGGVIINDHVIEGEHSHGGEVGHLRIELPDRGRLCGPGRRPEAAVRKRDAASETFGRSVPTLPCRSDPAPACVPRQGGPTDRGKRPPCSASPSSPSSSA